jgi:tRNA(Ile)-lysidine synthase
MIVEQIRDAVRAADLLGAAPAGSLGAAPAGSVGAAAPLVAMLSGGRDSVCLLDVATELRGARGVVALHVNYGLRADADADERFCVELCERLGVELRVLRTGAAEGNVQAWAREVRYAAARELSARLGAGASIATGHTASDQVETIVYRLAASPGRRALLGMAEREGAIVRPLLAFTREQTAAYCRERRLDWREDPSNEDLRYARARVRVTLVPALRTVHPAAESNVLRTARLLREETAVLDALVDAELQGRQSIALDRLAELAPALARMVVVRLAEGAAGTYVPQAGEHVDELLALARRGGSAELHVGGGAGAVIADGVLTMRRLPPRARSNPPPGGD